MGEKAPPRRGGKSRLLSSITEAGRRILPRLTFSSPRAHWEREVEGFEGHPDEESEDADSSTYVVGVRQPKRELAHVVVGSFQERGSLSDAEEARKRLSGRKPPAQFPSVGFAEPTLSRSRGKKRFLRKLNKNVSPEQREAAVQLVFAVIATISMIFGILYYAWLVQAFPPGPVIVNGTEPQQLGIFKTLIGNHADANYYNAGSGTKGQLSKDVSDWAAAALLICLPGDIVAGFYSFVAEAVLVSYIAKFVMYREIRESFRLILLFAASMLAAALIYTAFMYFVFVIYQEETVPEMTKLMGLNNQSDVEKYRESFRNQTKEYSFLYGHVACNLIMNVLDWNFLRLISREVRYSVVVEEEEFQNPSAAVPWASDGPTIQYIFLKTTSPLAMTVVALMVGFAVKAARRKARLVKHFCTEVSNIFVIIAVYISRFSVAVAFSVCTSILLRNTSPLNIFWMNSNLFNIPAVSLLVLTAALVIPSALYLASVESPFRNNTIYFRLIIVALISPDVRTEIVGIIYVFTTALPSKQALPGAFLVLKWIAADQSINIACSMFFAFSYFRVVEVELTFHHVIKMFSIAFWAGTSDPSSFFKLSKMIQSMGIIDRNCRCTDQLITEGWPLEVMARKLDMVVRVLEMVVCWTSVQLVQHFSMTAEDERLNKGML